MFRIFEAISTVGVLDDSIDIIIVEYVLDGKVVVMEHIASYLCCRRTFSKEMSYRFLGHITVRAKVGVGSVHGVKMFIENAMTSNELHSSSVFSSVIDKGGIKLFFNVLVVANGHVGVTVAVRLPLVGVEQFDFAINLTFDIRLGDWADFDDFTSCPKFSHFVCLFVAPQSRVCGDPSDFHLIVIYSDMIEGFEAILCSFASDKLRC